MAEVTALEQARRTGRPVEIEVQRTESMAVFAEPSGHFTARISPGPVRVRRGGGWVPVDTTLARRPGGSVAPAATVSSLRFSGGGRGPLVQLGKDGNQLALTWPGRLPSPVLAGSTATYPAVLPGVDLKLVATAVGFHEYLVVRTRAAALGLGTIRFGVRTAGLTMRAGKDGGSDLVDRTGAVVFTAPRPAMWDAGSRYATGRYEIGYERGGGSIGVVTDRRFLTDPATVFPVTIDPDYGPPGGGWAKVFSGKAGTSYWFGGDDNESDGSGNFAKVGRCDWGSDCNGIGVARSYFQFDIRALHGAIILNLPNVTSGAEFNAHNVRAPACGPPAGSNDGADLLWVWPFGAGLNWGNQPAYRGYEDTRFEMHGYDGNCGAAWMGWAAGGSVRLANNAGEDFVAYALAGSAEDDKYTWKKFTPDAGLLVHYDWPPNAPTNLTDATGTSQVPCSTDGNNPHYVNNVAGPLTLRATGTDIDGGPDLWTRIEWWNRGGSAEIANQATGPLGSGAVWSAVIPAGSFADGQALSWRARSADRYAAGPYSGWCQINIDNTKPTAPTVTPDDPGQPMTAGQPLTFTVRASNPDVTRFRYGLTQGGTLCSGLSTVDTKTLGGTATISVTPLKATKWDLWVTAIDRANNESTDCAKYEFIVAPGRPAVASWPLDGKWQDSAVPDTTGHGRDATVTPGPTTAVWTRGRVGDSLRFFGTSGSFVAPPGGPPVRTDQSFTVAAWVRMDGTDGTDRAAVSQDGNRVAGYFLGYAGDQQRFMFRMHPQDSETATPVRVLSPVAPQLGVWTHLVGVYDAGPHEIRLYVDGRKVGSAPITPGWTAAGGVQLGRARHAGQYQAFWPGAVDDVRIYDRVLGDLGYLELGEPPDAAQRSEIDRLAATPVEEVAYPLDEGSGTRAGDVSGSYSTGTLANGPTWTTDHLGAGALRFDGVNDAVETTRQPVRTDGSFTVTALARLDTSTPGWNANAWQTVASQDGPLSSGWTLRYRGDKHVWSFAVAAADAAAPKTVFADGDEPAVTDEWVHLTGVYDAGADEARLYINSVSGRPQVKVIVIGAPVRLNAPVAGNLAIGRAKLNGATTWFFAGEIDDVHVYSGVLSDPAIAEDSGRTEPRPPSLFAGTFERYASSEGFHFVGTGPPPPGFHLEGPLGLPAPAGAPNTQPVYSCRYTAGYFLSPQANCEGYEVLGTAGTTYITPPGGAPARAVYRCLVKATGDHFVSFDDHCESIPDKIVMELPLGYTRQYAPLVRYTGSGGLRWTSAHGALLPAGYTADTGLGYVAMTAPAGGQALRMCRDGADEFLTIDATCGTATDTGQFSGFLWPAAPTGVAASAQLYSCRSAGGERFESLDRFCDGSPDPGVSLGYVITRL